MSRSFRVSAGLLIVLSVLVLASPATAQWQVGDDKTNVKFGILVQPRAEMIDGDDTAQNLFFRRLRLIAGGKLNDKITFFIDTDVPNLGKGEGAGGTKNAGDIFFQDVALMYQYSPDQYVDAGMLLPALSHHGGQSAASQLATDYSPYAFLASGPTTSRVGRDYGVRLRGYVAGDHLEYRAGVYQGVRGPGSSNSLRFAGRLVYNVFEAEKGLFYGGTYLGKKKVLSFGASIDTQEEYSTTAVDMYWDQPVGAGGNAVVVQADWMNHDGDTFLPSFPEQNILIVEGGYYFGGSKLLPFVQYSTRDFDAATGVDEEKMLVGLGWMLDGHGRNVKFSWAQISPDGGDDLTELMVQFQLFKF